ncbi:2-phospho-L-lactate guanylyltransferase [Microbacterium sp. X-17]|uniref:2-phospho-L-lactate guanylyltransferase n=1 Tax=Microbacterium sp. X-17 TaxID=3144404 RepID=UPI0031F5B41D
MTRDWVVIVPVKRADAGKSRLATDDTRPALARAIALDTIAAAAACAEVARVIVVTEDPVVAREASALPGVDCVPDGTARGLNAALAVGAAAAGAGAPRAALLGDLPALRPAELALALRAAATLPRAVVADAEGTGSTLVTARAGLALETAFGADSFARHVELGAVPLSLPDAPSVHHDVDTPAQLAHAASLGLAPRTRALLP